MNKIEKLISEIRRYKHKADERLKIKGRSLADEQKDSAIQNLCGNLLHFLYTLEVKEVDLDKELENWLGERIGKWTGKECENMCRYFFGLGLSASNPITAADRGTAEEIIINLKRVEKDYRINLAKEIKWLRDKVKKG